MDYKQTLKDAQEKLKILATQRDALDREIEALIRIIEGAQIGSQDSSQWDPDNPAWIPKKIAETEPPGVTESMRKILRRHVAGLLPTEIRDALEMMGIEGSSPKNLLIHVHKALGRMMLNDEVVQVPRDGKMTYRLITRMERQFRSMTESLTGLDYMLDAGSLSEKTPPAKMTPPPTLGGGLKIPKKT